MFNIIKLNEKDNVGIAPMPIPKTSKVNKNLIAKDNIPFGHKLSLVNINKGDYIYKYGHIYF